MRTILADEIRARNELLADALADTIAELRLIDAGDMIAYIRAEQWANLSDLVQSSAELSFRDGVLTFGYTASFDVSWREALSIALALEFQARELTVFFTLTLGPRESVVSIDKLLFASPQADEAAGTRVLAQALFASRKPI